MEPSDLGRRIRDYVIPDMRKKYHITGQYLSLEAAVEVIQIVRLGLLTAGLGQLTEAQLSELGAAIEHQIHQQLKPQTGGPKEIVAEIERLWSTRPVTPATSGVAGPSAAARVKWLAVLSVLGMLLGIGLATLYFYSRGLIRQEVGKNELDNAIFAKATRDVIAQRMVEMQAKVAKYQCPGKTWEDEQKEVLACKQALVKATEQAEYARGRLDGLAHPQSLQIPEPATYHINRVTGVVDKMVRDQKNLLPRGAVEQARSELLRAAVQQGHTCK
jgi:hypothetical protein